jgi:hypothetical protein
MDEDRVGGQRADGGFDRDLLPLKMGVIERQSQVGAGYLPEDLADIVRVLHRMGNVRLDGDDRVFCPRQPFPAGELINGEALQPLPLSGLENRHTRKGIQGSNPCLSVEFPC